MRSEKFVRIGFWAALLLGLALHALTLPYSSNHWQDEAQICEMGRRVFERTDWNFYMLPERHMDKVPPGVWLVGPVVAEVSYRAMGHLGPKVTVLVCLLVSTLLLRFYLRRRTGSEVIADVASLIYFAAPALTQSARGARMDVFVFMLLFAALSVLQLESSTPSRRRWMPFLAGALSAFCVFSWPTAILLMPIVLWELCAYLGRAGWRLDASVRTLAWMTAGGLVASVLALIPQFGDPATSYEVYRAFSESSLNPKRVFRCREMLGSLQTGLYVYAVGLVCLFLSPRLLILLFGAVASFVICAYSHEIYVFKTLYFLPYAILGLAFFWQGLSRRFFAVAFAVVPCLLLLACYGRSVLVRNAFEFLSRPYRSVASQRQALTDVLPPGAKVYNTAWQTYYVGRELGWQQYQEKWLYQNASSDLLARMDAVLVQVENSSEAYEAFLRSHGFSVRRQIDVPAVGRSPCHDFLARRKRLMQLGPYHLFTRD